MGPWNEIFISVGDHVSAARAFGAVADTAFRRAGWKGRGAFPVYTLDAGAGPFFVARMFMDGSRHVFAVEEKSPSGSKAYLSVAYDPENPFGFFVSGSAVPTSRVWPPMEDILEAARAALLSEDNILALRAASVGGGVPAVVTERRDVGGIEISCDCLYDGEDKANLLSAVRRRYPGCVDFIFTEFHAHGLPIVSDPVAFFKVSEVKPMSFDGEDVFSVSQSPVLRRGDDAYAAKRAMSDLRLAASDVMASLNGAVNGRYVDVRPFFSDAAYVVSDSSSVAFVSGGEVLFCAYVNERGGISVGDGFDYLYRPELPVRELDAGGGLTERGKILAALEDSLMGVSGRDDYEAGIAGFKDFIAARILCQENTEKVAAAYSWYETGLLQGRDVSSILGYCLAALGDDECRRRLPMDDLRGEVDAFFRRPLEETRSEVLGAAGVFVSADRAEGRVRTAFENMYRNVLSRGIE